jgi:recombinational DNA repair protein (RecF pathway)
VKLQNPPAFEPTHCAQCGRIISLGEDGYSVLGSEYLCEECSAAKFRRLFGANAGR